MKTTVAAGIVATLVGLCGAVGQQAPKAAGVTNGASAMLHAAAASQYLFAFVYDKDDEATRAALKSFEVTVRKLSPAYETVAVNRSAPAEKDIVEKLGLATAPVPILLSIAPNGAVTGTVKPAELTEARLRDTLVSPGMQRCLKAVQDNSLVLVCLQNARTRNNEAAMQGVNEIKADGWYSQTTEVVKVDPSDPQEARFVAQLKVDPKTKKPVTVLLAPPGVVVSTIEGPTTKDRLKAEFKKASEGCSGPGCCPPLTK